MGWSTFRPGVNDTTFLDITLDPAFVGRYAGSATPLPLAITIPRFRTGFIDGMSLRGAVGPSAPFLLLTATCTSTPRVTVPSPPPPRPRPRPPPRPRPRPPPRPRPRPPPPRPRPRPPPRR